MKKFILLLFIHFSAYAQAVYCPAEVVCDQTNNLSSCHYRSSGKNYWNKFTGVNIIGTYKNSYVSAPYYSYDQGYAMCVYTHENSYKTLTLHAKPESNLEMMLQDHESWHFEESWWECKPTYEQACPLQEQAALLVHNKTDQNIYLSNHARILPGQFARLYHDDMIMGWVDIYDEYNYLGRVFADQKNQLKMTSIIDASYGLYELIGIENFNAVEVKG